MDKFIPDFIKFIDKNFNPQDHSFILFGDIKKFPVEPRPGIIYARRFRRITALIQMIRAQRVILHGLYYKKFTRVLQFFPNLLKKCFWVIWGSDLYAYQKHSRHDSYERARAKVIGKMGNFITHVHGDYLLAHEWYSASGHYHPCFAYPSNTFKELRLPPIHKKHITILAGNSAAKSNEHEDLFEKLYPFRNENIVIICPLSYGDASNAQVISKLGNELFGDKFIPLLEMQPLEEYQKLLANVDIAIFAHKRQQAMGNTISLLGLGKKVYLRTNVTSWTVFADRNITTFDFDDFSYEPIEDSVARNNIEQIRFHFSESMLTKQWSAIFEFPIHKTSQKNTT